MAEPLAKEAAAQRLAELFKSPEVKAIDGVSADSGLGSEQNRFIQAKVYSGESYCRRSIKGRNTCTTRDHTGVFHFVFLLNIVRMDLNH
jgi:hypothetical protein